MNPLVPRAFVSVSSPFETHPRSISPITHNQSTLCCRDERCFTNEECRRKGGQGKRANLPVADSEEDIAAVWSLIEHLPRVFLAVSRKRERERRKVRIAKRKREGGDKKEFNFQMVTQDNCHFIGETESVWVKREEISLLCLYLITLESKNDSLIK